MKVKELIMYLKTLDQDKGIWISYDCGYGLFPPIPDSCADLEDVERMKIIHNNDSLEVGDYIINAS